MNTLWHDMSLCAPALIMGAGALVLMMLEVLLRGPWPRAGVAGLFLIAALVSTLFVNQEYEVGQTILQGFIYADPFAAFFNLLICGGALLALMIGESYLQREGIEARGEYYALYLFSTTGALLLCNSAELIMLFLSLEIMSMALYCMCGSALAVRRSAEAALKYFFLGSFSSAFLLYGIAVLYGLTGTMQIGAISTAISYKEPILAMIGVGLMIVGLVFKIGAVPFHFWAPDVYDGAPTPVTAYMACVVKSAAIGVSIRILWVCFGALFPLWAGSVWTIALLTMVVGNVFAVKQRSVKRMLAYSSIAHAGYIMMAFLAQGGTYEGGAAALYYLVAYTVMTLGAFAVLLAVTQGPGGGAFSDDISKFNGLGSRRPVLAILMSLFLLSLAGIPPGMAGLLGKFYVFSAAIKSGYVGLAIVGVLSSAISCFYYLRVIVAMYFVEDESSEVSPVLAAPSAYFHGAIAVCAAGVVFLGIFPGWLYSFAAQVTERF
ncbi:MAG: NADH-quinone oxidoreductase subunit N [Oligoflexia bacterium]|nr:NADH-quinone oxidoreductase subunit N [Oligoflexia bacterium]